MLQKSDSGWISCGIKQSKFIAFNIFSCKFLITSCKILIITVISTGKLMNYHVWKIMSKRHNILPTRASFFALSAGKIESGRKFEIKPYTNHMFIYNSFQTSNESASKLL